ncbi:hypothetical protein M231_01569 [Tremella mesenterica]|uniref:Conserved oligomeric Golgi complex subunit 3 n=1 Tax=Tremella mesenterica TaxID=5217 RepID=A0A4Q1BSY4_TREME|nr:hypothetical protein M231_01569 [Tremella mesenterica]
MSRNDGPSYSIRRAPLNAVASSSTQSRSNTPNSRGITLEDWEAKAPLTDKQLQSINVVKDKIGQRPLPSRFTQPPAGSAPDTPTAPRSARIAILQSPDPSRAPSAAPSPRLPGGAVLVPPDTLHPNAISTPQQFHEHFTALTLSTEHEQDSLYRDHLAEIVGLREKCDDLIRLLRDGEGQVEEMLKCLEYVEERSESLRGACEDLLEEQTHLLTHTSHLAHRLTFFTFLESAQKMLNKPGDALVLSEDFLPMVKRLDECLEYLGEHRDFKDAEVYLLRYQQCMTRSMTLIKLYFVTAVRNLGVEVGKRTTDTSLSETATHALLYTKFVTLSTSLRPLIAELEHRVSSNPDELAALLGECHSAWVTTRHTLVGHRVNEEITRMEPAKSELVDLTRAGCSYLKQVCTEEFNLYKQFFLSGESQLYGFLEGLCDCLYDYIRPRILHEPSLETLCSVCTVLQALMVQDVTDDDDPDATEVHTPRSYASSPAFYGGVVPGDQEDYFSIRPASRARPGSFRQTSYTGSISGRQSERKRTRPPLSRLHTEVLLKMVLQDAQTRLVFRAQALIQADVQYYSPKEVDLDYPERLKGAPLSVERNAEDDDEPAILAMPPTETQDEWYPPLRATLWVLSCLYQYVDTAVFEDLAQEAITICRRSLTTASDLLSAKKDKMEDGRLFLVRHLLILKEMTAGLELSRRDREREWSGITDFLRALLENATIMLGYGKPTLPSHLPDAKTDVDRELKRACEDLISLCAARATLPLRTFIDRCTSYLSSSRSSTSTLSDQTFASPQKVKEVHDEFRKLCVGEVDRWESRLMLYLGDEETVRVLVPPAQNAIVDGYRQFHDLVRSEYDFSTAAGILTPSAVYTLLTSGTSIASTGGNDKHY